jgi:hypothetical protein
MNLKTHLLNEELLQTNDQELSRTFEVALKSLFSPSFYSKIEKVLKEKIQVLPFTHDENGAVAYNVNGKIYVNEREFGKLNTDRKVAYLLHEFIHVLQRKRTLGILSSFNEVVSLTNNLYKLISKNLTGSLSKFLTGKEMDIGPLKSIEVLAYTMNAKLHFEFTKEGTKEQFIKILQDSGLFNLNSFFWKERLER